jgi:hypothetical protein
MSASAPPIRLACFVTKADAASLTCKACDSPLVLGQCAVRRMTTDVFHVDCLARTLVTTETSVAETFHLFQAHLIPDEAQRAALLAVLGPRLLEPPIRKTKESSASVAAATSSKPAPLAASSSSAEQAQEVTPWSVTSDSAKGVDYERLVRDFGCAPITDALLARFQRVTGEVPHAWLRRGIFFSHRDLGKTLDLYEKGDPFYLYTGRGPSSDALHLGHLVPFMFCAWLQRVFKAPIVIQVRRGNTR